MRVIRLCLFWLLLALGQAATAQTFPALSGRVVDAANLLSPQQEGELTARLVALERQSGRQVVIATLPDLQNYDIADYGYRLGRAWGIGAKGKNDGALLIVAPKERKVRIEVGYGLEGVLTDALSSRIIRTAIVPRFKANDYPGGIAAGTEQLAKFLTLPPEEARAQAELAAKEAANKNRGSDPGLFIFALIMLFFILPLFFRRRYGRAYNSGIGPAILWGAMTGASGRSSGWGGGGLGGGGGFSGGGGSFGGGGASGGW